MASNGVGLRALIRDHSLVNDHIEYRVELHDTTTGNSTRLSSVSRRYREFTELHSQLCRFPQPFKVPSMPPKKYFGRTNPAFVTKRQQELQTFLDRLVLQMVQHPGASSAWRLLCLFLAVDPKHRIPASILDRGDQSAGGGGGTSVSLMGADHSRGYINVGDGEIKEVDMDGNPILAGQISGGAIGTGLRYDVSGKRVRSAQEIEAERLENIVNEFAKHTINVSRVFEERLGRPNDALLARINLNDLKQALETHVYTAPLFKNSEAENSFKWEAGSGTAEARKDQASDGSGEIKVDSDTVGTGKLGANGSSGDIEENNQGRATGDEEPGRNDENLQTENSAAVNTARESGAVGEEQNANVADTSDTPPQELVESLVARLGGSE